MPTYEWYEVVQGSELQQGDIIEGVDIYIALPHQEGQEELVPSLVETHNVIILTQSCDIVKEACQNIVVCPVWTVGDAKEAVSAFSQWERP